MKYHKILVLLFASIFISSGCGLLKKYDRPEIAKEKNYRVDSVSTDTVSMAQYSWKDIFADPILQAYIEQALANNFDVLKAQQNIQIAQASFKQSRAALLPNVNAELGLSRNKLAESSFQGQNFPSGGVSFNDAQLGIGFSWELDVWGRISSLKRAAYANYLYAENSQRLIKSILVSNVASNYYSLLALEAQRKVLEATIINRTEGLETIKALKTGGLVTEVAVKQNEALLYNAQAILINVSNEIKLRENALSILLAKAPDSIARGKLDSSSLTADAKIGLPIQILDNRPDVVIAENNLMRAFQLTNAAQASFYPRLSISGSGGLNSENFNELFSTNALFSNLLGNLSQPIFNQRFLRTQKQVRKAEQEIALLDYKQKVLDAYREVSDALYSYNAFDGKLIIQKKEMQALEQAVQFSEELQKQGLANYLEVLRAKDNTLSTQLNVIDTQLKGKIAMVNLYRALGGGWK